MLFVLFNFFYYIHIYIHNIHVHIYIYILHILTYYDFLRILLFLEIWIVIKEVDVGNILFI